MAPVGFCRLDDHPYGDLYLSSVKPYKRYGTPASWWVVVLFVLALLLLALVLALYVRP